MPKSTNQKLKLLYLIRFFEQRTDEMHFATMEDILQYLHSCGITAERKSLYSDIDALRDFDYDIVGSRVGRDYRYHLASRNFELTELRLLIDAVQSSKSITEERSRGLIEKLEHFTSDYNARSLHKHVIVKNRVKTINKAIYYTMDSIDEAMSQNKRIDFEYLQWNIKKELVPKKTPVRENISPWAFIWDNECYYMLAYDPADERLKNFRLDKIKNVTVVHDGEREGRTEFEKVDLAVYSNEHFNMFGGDVCSVKLECKNSAANYIIDKFGTDIIIMPKDENTFTVSVDVSPSPMFFGWILGLNGNVRIAAPKSLRREMREHIKNAAKLYPKEEK